MGSGVELLPCPFCGGAAQAVTGPVPQRWGVVCDSCDVFQDSRSPSRDEAIGVWNTRQQSAEIDRLREALERIVATSNRLANYESERLAKGARAALSQGDNTHG